MATQTTPTETEELWRTATWLTPFVFQIALALLVAVAWLAGKFALTSHFLSLIGGTVVVTVVLAVVGWWCLQRKTPRSRALAFSVFGCAAGLLVGGMVATVILDTVWR